MNLNGHFFGTLNNLLLLLNPIILILRSAHWLNTTAKSKFRISWILRMLLSLCINRLETTASVLRQLIGLEKLTNMDKLGD